MPVRLPLRGADVTAIVPSPSGDVWILANQVALRLHQGSIRRSDVGLPDRVNAVTASPSGLFFATDNGLFWLDELRGAQLATQVVTGPVSWATIDGNAAMYGVPTEEHRASIFTIPLDVHGRPAGQVSAVKHPQVERVRRIVGRYQGDLVAVDANYKTIRLPKTPAPNSAPVAFPSKPLDEDELFKSSLALGDDSYAVLTSRRLYMFTGAAAPRQFDRVGGLALERAGQKTFWLLSSNRVELYDFEGSAIVDTLKIPPPLQALAVAEDRARRVWLGTKGGLFVSPMKPAPGQVLSVQNRDVFRPPDYSFVPTPRPAFFRPPPLVFGPANAITQLVDNALRRLDGPDNACTFPTPPCAVSSTARFALFDDTIARLSNCKITETIPLPVHLQVDIDVATLHAIDRSDRLLEQIHKSPWARERLESALAKTSESTSLAYIERTDELAGLILSSFDAGERRRLLAEGSAPATEGEVLAESDTAAIVKRSNSLALVDFSSKSVSDLPLDISISQLRTTGQGSASGNFFVLAQDGAVIHVGQDFSMRKVDVPAGPLRPTAYRPQRPWTLFAAPDTDRALLVNAEQVVSLVPGSPAVSHLTAQAGGRNLVMVGLQSESSGALLAGLSPLDSNDPFTIYRIGADMVWRKLLELPSAVDSRTSGRGSLLRDSGGRLWVGTSRGIQTKTDAGADASLVHIGGITGEVPAILEYPAQSGRIWAIVNSQREGALWQLAPAAPHLVETFPRTLSSLSPGPAPSGTGEALWIGGDAILAVMDGENARSTDVLQHLKLPRSVTVHKTARQGSSMLLLTDGGLLRLQLPNRTVHTLRSWSTAPDDRRLTLGSGLAAMKDGSAIAFVITGMLGVPSNVLDTNPGSTIFRILAGSIDSTSTVPAIVSAVTESQKGIFAGTLGGVVYRLGGQSEVVTRMPTESSTLTGSLRSACYLYGGRMLLLADEILYAASLDRQSRPRELKAPTVKSWSRCAPISASEAIVVGSQSLTTLADRPAGLPPRPGLPVDRQSSDPARLLSVSDKSGTFSTTALNCAGVTSCPVFRDAATSPKLPGHAWLYADGEIWHFSAANRPVRRLVKLPGYAQQIAVMAVDTGGIWIGTELFGALRWTGDPSASTESQGTWAPYDELHKLPANDVRAIVAHSPEEAVLLTAKGMSRAVRKDDKWIFRQRLQDGIVGTEVRGSSVLRLADRHVVAVATPEAVSIGAITPGGGPVQWMTIDPQRSFGSRRVRALDWCDADKSLWVGVDNKIVVYTLTSAAGSATPTISPGVLLKPEFSATIDQLRVTPDCRAAWAVLTEEVDQYALQSSVVRWTRAKDDDGTIVHTDPIYFSMGRVWLAPVSTGRGMHAIFRDDTSTVSWWPLSSLSEPRVEIAERLFWIAAKGSLVDLASPGPGDSFPVSMAIDRHPSGESRTWRWSPDLFRNRSYGVVATVTDAASGRSWSLVERRELETGPWATRLTLMAAVFVGMVFVTGRGIARSLVRRRRLRANEIPYVVGKAVEGDGFFGREELLRLLRDSVAVNSVALIGDWRIGKSSLQKRLAAILKSPDVSKEYAYLPVWIDLQFLFGAGAPGEDGLFHFLGKRVVEETLQHTTEELTAQLHWSAVTRPSEYTSIDLENDLGLLMEHWKAHFPPRSPVLLLQIDEAGLLYKVSYDTLLAFRAIFVNVQGVHTVMSGKRLPENRTGDYMSPWKNFLLKEIEVGPLTFSEARRLVVEPAKSLFTFEEPAVEQVVAMSQSRPMAIQEMCANILRYKYAQGHIRRRITKADVEAAREWQRQHVGAPPEAPTEVEADALASLGPVEPLSAVQPPKSGD